jgi:hypothetical protein
VSGKRDKKKKGEEPAPHLAPEPAPAARMVPALLRNEGCSVRLSALDGSELDASTRIEVSAYQPTCLALRAGLPHELERGVGALAAIGLYSGECVLLDPVTGKVLAVWNCGSLNAKGKVTAVAWVPKMEWQVAVAFASGATLFFDVERAKEDQLDPRPAKPATPTANGGPGVLEVAHPKSSKHNPRMVWRFGVAAIRALAFSPDGSMVALASQAPPPRIHAHIHSSRRNRVGLFCTRV